jgi:hypothetical protein
MTLKSINSALQGDFVLDYNIYLSGSKQILLSFNIDSGFTFAIDYANQYLNLKLTGLNLLDLTISFNSYGFCDENLLRTWSFDTLNSYFGSNQFFIFKNSFHFDDLFETSKIIYNNEGLIIAGTPKYFTTIPSTLTDLLSRISK